MLTIRIDLREAETLSPPHSLLEDRKEVHVLFVELKGLSSEIRKSLFRTRPSFSSGSFLDLFQCIRGRLLIQLERLFNNTLSHKTFQLTNRSVSRNHTLTSRGRFQQDPSTESKGIWTYANGHQKRSSNALSESFLIKSIMPWNDEHLGSRYEGV
jgi:hypothetical protein